MQIVLLIDQGISFLVFALLSCEIFMSSVGIVESFSGGILFIIFLKKDEIYSELKPFGDSGHI